MRDRLVGLLVFLLLVGGALVVAVNVTEDRKRVRAALRAAGDRYARAGKLPADAADWMDAIGYVESRWRLSATNTTGPDGARGGAFGPTQITARTAAALGYTGDARAFAQDADLAAEWTARILADARPRTFADAVGAWNAGRYNADTDDDGMIDALPASHVTVREYWPRAVAALDMVRAELAG